MQIQPNNNIVSKIAADGQKPVVSKQQRATAGAAYQSVILGDDFGKLLELAQNPSDDGAKVEQARLDLKSGRLDTQEAVLSAAENMITLGI